MTPHQAREQAEKSFKQAERAREGREAMAVYHAEVIAVRAKTVRLKALRLAKEALALIETPPVKTIRRRPHARRHIAVL